MGRKTSFQKDNDMSSFFNMKYPIIERQSETSGQLCKQNPLLKGSGNSKHYKFAIVKLEPQYLCLEYII